MTLTANGLTHEIKRVELADGHPCEADCDASAEWSLAIVDSDSASNGFTCCDRHLAEWLSSQWDDEQPAASESEGYTATSVDA